MKNINNGASEDYTTRYLLDYDYIKNDYRLIAVDLNSQRKQMVIQK